MWYVKSNQLTPEEDFIFRVQFLAHKYGVNVEIDQRSKVVNFLAEDELTQIKLAHELSKIFSKSAI